MPPPPPPPQKHMISNFFFVVAIIKCGFLIRKTKKKKKHSSLWGLGALKIDDPIELRRRRGKAMVVDKVVCCCWFLFLKGCYGCCYCLFNVLVFFYRNHFIFQPQVIIKRNNTTQVTRKEESIQTRNGVLSLLLLFCVDPFILPPVCPISFSFLLLLFIQ